MTESLSVDTARQLLDFTGGDSSGVIGPQAAEEQLIGAVAIHNLLARQNVAYLADEVGMGKTYVALGAVALFRHFNPSFRVLVIAPRENIQDKWIREWRNFVRSVVRVDDLRMKAIGGEPARSLVKAATLADLVSKVAQDPDRDFFARLTSFSLAIAASSEGAEKPRRALRRALPWLDASLLSMVNKEDYKRNFGRAVNCALPKFDLVIVDEGHNLKAGWRLKGATRNLVVGCALGAKDAQAAKQDGFRGYGSKAERVLFLSATPIEHDFEQLWNQLDLLGHGEVWRELADKSLNDQQKMEIAKRVLVRRVGMLKAGAATLTKNQYRREWRQGGASIHDKPMEIPDDRQKLTVALVQKKVSEVLGHAKHDHSFQVGLLASFESFAETASRRGRQAAVNGGTEVEEEEGEGRDFYTHPSAARDVDEREGMDIGAVDVIARDYQRKFKKALPHPKMDKLVDQLSACLANGQKALVFVRRVASVDELQRKLEERYDEVLRDRLKTEIKSAKVRDELDIQFAKYEAQRIEERYARRAVEDRDGQKSKADAGGESSNSDTFFSWFFRGDGPPDTLSGARLAERLDNVSGVYSTFFEDNYLAAILQVPPSEALAALGSAASMAPDRLRAALRSRTLKYLPYSPKTIRLETFRAFQRAALELLEETSGPFRAEAHVVLGEMFLHGRRIDRTAVTIPEPDEWLSAETLFTALRQPSRARSTSPHI